VCFIYLTKSLRISSNDIPKKELNSLHFMIHRGILHLLHNNSVGVVWQSRDSHRSQKSFVLPDNMWGKFGIASTICSLIETSYPGALYYKHWKFPLKGVRVWYPKIWRCSWKIQFFGNTRLKTLEDLSKTFWNDLAMSVKSKESTQWNKFLHIATAIATTVYYKNVTKNIV